MNGKSTKEQRIILKNHVYIGCKANFKPLPEYKEKHVHLGVHWQDTHGAPLLWPGPWQPELAAYPAPLPSQLCSHTHYELFFTWQLHQIYSPLNMNMNMNTCTK